MVMVKILTAIRALNIALSLVMDWNGRVGLAGDVLLVLLTFSIKVDSPKL